MNHSLHIVIATHGRPDLLKRTLDSLAQCRIPECLAKTIIIENGGTPNAELIVNRASAKLKATYQFTARGNKSWALNLALQGIDDGLVVFFDDDVRLAPHALEAYVAAANRYGEGHFFGGPFGVDYEQEPPQWLKQYLTPCALGWEPTPDNWARKGTTDFFGCNWAVFAEDVKELGGFDPDLGPSCVATGEESDLQIRLRAKGVKPQYIELAKVWHYVPSSRCSAEWLLDRAARVERGKAAVAKARRWSRLRLMIKKIGFQVEPRWIRYRLNLLFSSNEEIRFRSHYYLTRRRTTLEIMDAT